MQYVLNKHVCYNYATHYRSIYNEEIWREKTVDIKRVGPVTMRLRLITVSKKLNFNWITFWSIKLNQCTNKLIVSWLNWPEVLIAFNRLYNMHSLDFGKFFFFDSGARVCAFVGQWKYGGRKYARSSKELTAALFLFRQIKIF